MLNLKTIRGTSHSSTCFVLAIALFAGGGLGNPFLLVVTLAFIAVNLAVRHSTRDIFLDAMLLILVTSAFGYSIGRHLSHRDNPLLATPGAEGR